MILGVQRLGLERRLEMCRLVLVADDLFQLVPKKVEMDLSIHCSHLSCYSNWKTAQAAPTCVQTIVACPGAATYKWIDATPPITERLLPGRIEKY